MITNQNHSNEGPEGLKFEWQKIEQHFQKIKDIHLRKLFDQNKNRGSEFFVKACDWYLDYSKQRVTQETISLLLDLAKASDVESKRDAMFEGKHINFTENRAAAHIALRNPQDTQFFIDGRDVIPEIHRVLLQMEQFSDEIRSGRKKGHTGKPIKNIINIGIGGSDLGPKMAYDALKYYCNRNLTFRFVSNIDDTDFIEKTIDLDPEETLFIIASKTFKTDETMTNANIAKEWVLKKISDTSAISTHFVAVSTNKEEVEKFGIDGENMFEFWDWVGGRYSLPSAIGLPLMISIGKENFKSMLNGFHVMDIHFKETSLEKNMPVIMALLSIWNTNFFDIKTQAILPYDEYLNKFPSYLQQLIMESNGKSVTKNGKKTQYQTSPVIWGETGTKGQHSFYQLIHQGTQIIPSDFIGFTESLSERGESHQKLLANLVAQSKSLAFGKTEEELSSEGVVSELTIYKTFEGNRPSNTLLAKKLTPNSFGQLISLYEHITFVQGVIWNINSFDQFGVELGKIQGKKILERLKGETLANFDTSTESLLSKIEAPTT